MAIDAPMYPPSSAYHQPAAAPFEFGADSMTIEELLSAPATKALVMKYAPWIQALLSNPAFTPFATVFTLRHATPFLPGDFTKPLADLDADLKALPRSQWPANVG